MLVIRDTGNFFIFLLLAKSKLNFEFKILNLFQVIQ